MKTLPVMSDEVTTLGWLLDVVPLSLPAAYLTTIGANYSDDTSSPSLVYQGDPGFVMGEVRITSGDDPPTLAVEIPVSDTGPILRTNVELGLYRGAEVTLRIIDYVDESVSQPIGFRWVVGQTTITDDGKATFEIRADTRVRRELILKKYGPGCKADLGDTYCGVDVLGLWTDTVTVASVINAYNFTITGNSVLAVDGYYANGAIKFTSGDNLNIAYTVRRWDESSNLVTLWEPLRAGLLVGATGLIHAGCDKSKTAGGCLRFNNFARRIAWDHLPPDDAKFSYEFPPEPPVTNVIEPDPVDWNTITNGTVGWVG